MTVSGTRTIPPPFQPGSVGFESVDNPATRRRVRLPATDGKGFQADIVYLNVTGNRAWMILVITQSTDGTSGMKGRLRPGQRRRRGDRFRLRDVQGNPGESITTNADQGTAIRGNIYLANNGAFARNP